MTHILRIDASARTTGSVSRTLSDRVIARFAETGDITVTTRDLAEGLPLLTEDWVGANFTAPDDRSPEQEQALALSDSLVEELKAADILVIGLPIYNFGVPAALKAWIDLICRAGVTFRYTTDGPVGLLSGKRAVINLSSGGTEAGSEIDFASTHLRQVLGFIGISDVQMVRADRQGVDAEASRAKADADLEALQHAA